MNFWPIGETTNPTFRHSHWGSNPWSRASLPVRTWKAIVRDDAIFIDAEAPAARLRHLSRERRPPRVPQKKRLSY
jgi:hypothetical protein